MKRKGLRIATAACTALVMSVSPLVVSSVKADAPSYEVVDPSVQYQTMQGWGTSLAWFANILGGAPDGVRNQIADLLFDPTKGIGLNVLRYNIGGGENPKYTSLQLRARMQGFEPTQGTWDWTADANQRWFLQAAKARGANVFEAFSNSPPYWMTNSGSVSGAQGGGDNLNPAYTQAFASYLATVVQHFQENWGIQFGTVEPLNEPSGTWWGFGGSQEGDHEDTTAQAQIIDALGTALAQNKSVTRVSAPDESSIDQTVSSWGTYDASTRNVIAQINTHTYGGSNRTGLYNAAFAGNKRLWMSEHGDGDGTGLTMSDSIVQDMTYMHPSAWVYWQAVDNANGWGFLYNDLNNPSNPWTYTVNEKYYVMGQYSKFIRPGDQIIRVNNVYAQADTVGAIDHTAHDLILVATNDGGASKTINYDLSGFTNLGNAAAAYQTSEANGLDEHIQQIASTTIANGQLTVVLPAQSVTTFVIPDAQYTPSGIQTIHDYQTGSAVNQVQYSGNWTAASGQDGVGDFQSTTSGDQYAVHFEGTQAKFYGDKGPTLGIESISVDGGPVGTVDLYAPTVERNVFIYATPTVQSGMHTVTVRNTGRVDSNELSAGSGAFTPLIPSERVEVVPDNSLLQNSGFETGDLTGWQGQWNPSYASVEAGNPYNGGYDGALHPQNGGDVGMDQSVTAPTTGTYTVTAECATAFPGGVQLGANVNGNGMAHTYINATGTYQPYTLTFQAKAGDTINIWYYAARSSWNWANIDDVRLIGPPNTASLAVQPVVTSLSPGGATTVTGTVYTSPGVPAKQATVSLLAYGGGTITPAQVVTDDSGTFSFQYTAPQAPGIVHLVASADVNGQVITQSADVAVGTSPTGQLPEVPLSGLFPLGILGSVAAMAALRRRRRSE